MSQRIWKRAMLAGIELEYVVEGTGAPVVLIHPGHFADWFMPLLDESALADHYQVLAYHRVGCVGSSPITDSIGFAEQAAHCRLLMRHLGIARAHVVGHSSSGLVALQLALDSPDTVHTLALLEPSAVTLLSSGAPGPGSSLDAIFQRYYAGDKAGAVNAFLEGVCGPGYRAVLDQKLPGAFAQHVADADTFFLHEAPAVLHWVFTREDTQRITQPVLMAIGAKSNDAMTDAIQELLLSWLPNAEPFVLPDATHLMQVENPRGMAEGLVAFYARHPLAAGHGIIGEGVAP
jgi:pimeloyl-ACP methyl ester carboxylesterase